MTVEFDASINDKDMYSFNLHHAYTSMQGILTIIIGLILVSVSAYTAGRVDSSTTFIYGALGLVFLIYVPLSLKSRSKRQIKNSEALQHPLHYTFGEDGIHVRSEALNDEALLPYEMVYKISTTGKYLLVYSNRVNAYIIPRSVAEPFYPQLKELLAKKVKDYKLSLKW